MLARPLRCRLVSPASVVLSTSLPGLCAQLSLQTNIGTVAALDDAVAAFNPTERIKGKTIIRGRP